MTKEDKDLLLKDLCARLPYNVRVEYKGKTHSTIYDVLGVAHGRLAICLPFMSYTEHPLVEEAKPYLFPLSSMTEEQMFDFATVQSENCKGSYPTLSECSAIIDWGYKHHFDVNSLIEKGLALDATGLNIY
jgi:hypothetical protein